MILHSRVRRPRLLPALLLPLMILACTGTPQGSPPPDNGSGGSGQRASDSQRRHPLGTLATATILVNGHEVEVWLARTPDQQEEGLMHVPPAEIADNQGMLFVFPAEQVRSFWMKNTITALDIAFTRSDGTIVRTHTMPPRTLQGFSSGEPARFALEMKAGSFARLGVVRGQRIVIPPDVFEAP